MKINDLTDGQLIDYLYNENLDRTDAYQVDLVLWRKKLKGKEL